MEELFLSFSESLPAATLMMLLVVFVTRRNQTAVRRHQLLLWGLLAACLLPALHLELPKWRILPHPETISGFTASASAQWSGFAESHLGFSFVAAVWMAGTTVLLSRMFLSICNLHYHRRETMPVDCPEMLAVIERLKSTLHQPAVEVAIHPSYPMPMTWGWFRPEIWLPLEAEDWTEEELECVLVHEMAHIERRDFLTELVSRLAVAIYWFHPLAWLINRHMELAREMACDDQVLLTGKTAGSYAATLGHLGAGLRLPVMPPATAAGFFGSKPLLARAIGIADPWRTRSRLTNEEVLGSAAPVAAMAVFIGSLGFKAAAEIHVDQTPQLATATSQPVVSIWDDFVKPVRIALTTVDSRTSSPPIGASSSADVTTPTRLEGPGHAIVNPTESTSGKPYHRSTPASATQPSESPPVSVSRPQDLANHTAGRIARGRPIASSTPESGIVASSPSSTPAPDGGKGLNVSAPDPSSGNSENPPTVDGETPADTRKVTAGGTELRRIAAVTAKGEFGAEHSFNLFVSKHVESGTLVPEVSYDLIKWSPLSKEVELVARRSATDERDQLTYKLSATQSKNRQVFIRIVQAPLAVPTPGKDIGFPQGIPIIPNKLNPFSTPVGDSLISKSIRKIGKMRPQSP